LSELVCKPHAICSQKSPIVTQKSPVYTQRVLYTPKRALYTPEWALYTLTRAQHTLSYVHTQEPYIHLRKKREKKSLNSSAYTPKNLYMHSKLQKKPHIHSKETNRHSKNERTLKIRTHTSLIYTANMHSTYIVTRPLHTLETYTHKTTIHS